MDIDRNNYEAFLLDLLEGRLSPEEEQKLNAFLKNHPEFVADLPDVDLFKLEKKSLVYPNSDLLKKKFPVAGTPLTESNFDMFCLARLEGDLSQDQEQEHRALVERDKSKGTEWKEWQRTIMTVEQLSFPGKNALKRKTLTLSRKFWLSGLAVAASFALLFFLLRTERTVPGLAESVSSESLSTRENMVVAQEAVTENLESKPLTALEIPVKEVRQVSDNKPQVASTHPEPGKEVQESRTKNPTQLNLNKIQARPLRIAGSLSGTSAMVGQPRIDYIKPLPDSQVSGRTSKLPLNEIAEIDRQVLFDEFTREHNISLLSVANAGIKGINKLTGSDISLMASRDEQGEVSGFRLKSKRFSLSKPLSRHEAEK